MSIFGSLGKLFGYKGASAEAFGGSFAEKASTTFTDRFNKSIDSFEKQVEETDKLLLADELTEAKISKAELSEALKGYWMESGNCRSYTFCSCFNAKNND